MTFYRPSYMGNRGLKPSIYSKLEHYESQPNSLSKVELSPSTQDDQEWTRIEKRIRSLKEKVVSTEALHSTTAPQHKARLKKSELRRSAHDPFTLEMDRLSKFSCSQKYRSGLVRIIQSHCKTNPALYHSISSHNHDFIVKYE